jgi:hypothetical protein
VFLYLIDEFAQDDSVLHQVENVITLGVHGDDILHALVPLQDLVDHLRKPDLLFYQVRVRASVLRRALGHLTSMLNIEMSTQLLF